ncbi:PREDICTED: putative calcium-transporting ATPase 13, plasma membrane-type [Nelumbo nucifera]|uniref:Calcium-transporting ATPase n=2 Tax=Nelumbo nucifera TaxID=4432 RepID=A0A822XEB7_NELNU|nr:PREDICTED: putative calcium-transporting ATPase 13, plasma membrane-type [Nelumbo nucifera]DAD19794.1 TPA_asm: hypothetical protein HUJ06_021257 [Nelumbo nucifera]
MATPSDPSCSQDNVHVGSFFLTMPTNPTKSQQRWRLAFKAIYISRVFFSLVNDVLAKKKDQFLNGILRSPSYIALDIHPKDDGDNAPFSNFDHKSFIDMVKEKNLESLRVFGGVEGVVAAFKTDAKNGIRGHADDLNLRRHVFGSNTYKNPPAIGFFHFVLEGFKDTTILILCACATLSLVFGIQQHGLKEGWYDGGSILLAVFLVIVVSAVSNFKQSRQFEKLSDESSNINVDVIRDGRRQQISIFDIVVGDVVCLKIGDQIPADGLFLNGHSLQVDESSMTGESDHVDVDASQNPFLFSGAKVTDGFAHMLVTSVGMNTTWGEMMSSITQDSDEETPLQVRLNMLTSYIGKVGLAIALLVLVVMLIRYFTGHIEEEDGISKYKGHNTKFNDLMNALVSIISAAVTIVVVAIPEGLPLAVTLSLAYSMKKMMADNAMVRKLAACETMGSATTICTDKTGTLTLNQMKVNEFWVGEGAKDNHASFVIAPNLVDLLGQGVSLNTTGSVYRPAPGMEPEVSGSPTEKAILSWAVSELGMDMDEVKQCCTVLHVEAFNSEKKRSGVLIKTMTKRTIDTHWKGAAEMILAMCSNYYERNGTIKTMDESKRIKFKQIIEGMAAKTLRCIAFAHKSMPEVEIEGGLGYHRLQEDSLTLLGLVGLKDPCRPEVKTAVKACRDAGVNIKMVTGDNIFTARAIAIECGILEPDEEVNNEAVVEGVEFRSYSAEERMEKIDKIKVMARSSPLDKLLMVQSLKQKGHVVAVTGDGTNDAPALREADIGLSMGIQGTEVAKESSDIVILDDNFASVATVLRWGRCVYNNIQKFIQFQLTVNIAALVINFMAAISSGEVPLTAVQMLWVNLIMDTLGALALATEQPTKELMEKPPVGRTEPLITNIMWRNLTTQALYQVIILLTLEFKGKSIFNINEKIKDTLIFNTFVFCQVFNEFNARRLEKKNIFEEIHRSRLFLGIVGMTVILQVLMVEFLKRFANTEQLNVGQWLVCIGIAALSWPIAFLVKFIPVSDKPLLSLLRW